MSFRALRRYQDVEGVHTIEFHLSSDLILREPFLDWENMMRIQKWCQANCAMDFRAALSHVRFDCPIDMEMCYLAFR